MSGTNNIEPVASEIKLFAREENTTAMTSSENGEQPVKKLTSHDESTMKTHDSSQFRRAKFFDKYMDATYTEYDYMPPVQLSKPRIQKVSLKLKAVEANKNCFDPLVVSIGPYHHGRPEFQMMEDYKYECAKRLMSHPPCDHNISFEHLYNLVYEMAGKLRDCYADDYKNHYDDNHFTEIMVLDGCFVLDFIFSFDSSEGSNDFQTRDSIKRDLFLLENQLPLEVLQVLMRKKCLGHEGNYKVYRFIDQQILNIKWDKNENNPGNETTFRPPSTRNRPGKALHLLDCLRNKLLVNHRRIGTALRLNWSEYSAVRSVKEIKAAGIIFKISKIRSLPKISFHSGKIYGEMSLPQIPIMDSTKSMFLNLVAYEMCPDSHLDINVISYLCLMNELIQDAKDAKELRSKGIFLNYLGSDQQLADLFKEMAIQLVPDPKVYYYVKQDIERHYQKKFALAIIHFWNSWASIGVTAASLALILTIIQTFFTIFPLDKLK